MTTLFSSTAKKMLSLLSLVTVKKWKIVSETTMIERTLDAIRPNAPARLSKMQAAAVHRDYDAFAGVDRGVREFYDWTLRRKMCGRVIDVGRRPDTSRPAPPEQDQQVGDASNPAVPPTSTMRTMLRWFAARGNQPATTDAIAEGLNLSAMRVRYVIRDQGWRFLRRVGQVPRPGGGPPSHLYVAISPEEHAEIRAESSADRLVQWFVEHDNRPTTADDVVEDLGLGAARLRQIMNTDARFCCVGKVTGPNGGRARNLYQLEKQER